MFKLSIVVLVFCLAYAVYCADRYDLKEEVLDGNLVDVMEKRSAQRPPSLKTRWGRADEERDLLVTKRAAQRPPSYKLRFGRSKNRRQSSNSN
ncbi:head peptide [Aedes albopictus]|uniref:Secreted protein n=1 Tax=Aedes albopictus TaxID=7160 RepID=A0ABM1ZYP4_AEDAL|nr:head peptide-like [Aedes albopictus]